MPEASTPSVSEAWRRHAVTASLTLGVLLVVLCSRRACAAGAVDAVAQDGGAGTGADARGGRRGGRAARLGSAGAARGRAGAAHRRARRGHGSAPVRTRTPPSRSWRRRGRSRGGRARSCTCRREIAKGDLRTTLDVYPSMANAWDRIRNPLPSPTSHAFATAKIDAEVRAFLAPLVLEQASVHHARHDEGEVLAAACGDVDGDGGDELVLVSRARVVVGRVRSGKFVAERTAAWSALAPRVSRPGARAARRRGRHAGRGATSARPTARGLALTPDLAGHTSLAGVPVVEQRGPGVPARRTRRRARSTARPSTARRRRDAKPKLARACASLRRIRLGDNRRRGRRRRTAWSPYASRAAASRCASATRRCRPTGTSAPSSRWPTSTRTARRTWPPASTARTTP